MLIESIKIKLTNGKELELTADEARSLFQELDQMFGSPRYIPYPISVPSIWQPEPIKPYITWTTTTGTTAFPLENVQ